LLVYFSSPLISRLNGLEFEHRVGDRFLFTTPVHFDPEFYPASYTMSNLGVSRESSSRIVALTAYCNLPKRLEFLELYIFSHTGPPIWSDLYLWSMYHVPWSHLFIYL